MRTRDTQHRSIKIMSISELHRACYKTVHLHRNRDTLTALVQRGSPSTTVRSLFYSSLGSDDDARVYNQAFGEALQIELFTLPTSPSLLTTTQAPRPIPALQAITALFIIAFQSSSFLMTHVLCRVLKMISSLP